MFCELACASYIATVEAPKSHALCTVLVACVCSSKGKIRKTSSDLESQQISYMKGASHDWGLWARQRAEDWIPMPALCYDSTYSCPTNGNFMCESLTPRSREEIQIYFWLMCKSNLLEAWFAKQQLVHKTKIIFYKMVFIGHATAWDSES